MQITYIDLDNKLLKKCIFNATLGQARLRKGYKSIAETVPRKAKATTEFDLGAGYQERGALVQNRSQGAESLLAHTEQCTITPRGAVSPLVH